MSRVTTDVNIFPGLPHGFRRFNQLASTKVFDSLTIDLIPWVTGIGGEQQGRTKEWKVDATSSS